MIRSDELTQALAEHDLGGRKRLIEWIRSHQLELVRARELLHVLVDKAVLRRDTELLQLTLRANGLELYYLETIAAAGSGWILGYDLLRLRLPPGPIPGMGLEAAYLVRDHWAYDGTIAVAQMRADVAAFWDWARIAGLSPDDVISFLVSARLSWAVNYAMGLEDEFGQPRRR